MVLVMGFKGRLVMTVTKRAPFSNKNVCTKLLEMQQNSIADLVMR